MHVCMLPAYRGTSMCTFSSDDGVSVLSALKHLLDRAAQCLFPQLLCSSSSMSPKGKAKVQPALKDKALAKAKAKAQKAKDKAQEAEDQLALQEQDAKAKCMSQMAVPFRNLMRYRASAQCKKAFSLLVHSCMRRSLCISYTYTCMC